MQKQFLALFTRIALLVCVLPMWLWVMDQPFASHVNLGLIVGGVLLVYPVVWLGRILLDANPTLERAIWITIFVHYAVGGLFGMAIIRALATSRTGQAGNCRCQQKLGWRWFT